MYNGGDAEKVVTL